jgi:tRNA(Met) C34 N-acetyltransferase TmcA
VLVGDRGKDQVVNLHYILSKAQVKARPSVLWCYNKELGFSTCVGAPRGVGARARSEAVEPACRAWRAGAARARAPAPC